MTVKITVPDEIYQELISLRKHRNEIDEEIIQTPQTHCIRSNSLLAFSKYALPVCISPKA